MATETDNYKLITPEGNWNFDIENENKNMRVIDKGLVLDVGDSTGTGNDYILNIGSITLTTNNKGIAFRFWADKDSTGAVKINTNYNLLKGVGKPVSNLKAGNPYTVVYDGGSNFFLGSGSSTDSDLVTATEKDVLINKTFIGSDEEIHTGSMSERGTVTKNLSANGTITLPEGHYNSITIKQTLNTLAANTYTPGTANQVIAAGQYLTGAQTIKGDANLIASNIISGKSLFGVSGSATVYSLGGKYYATGTISSTSGNFSRTCGFKPVFVFIQSGGNALYWINSTTYWIYTDAGTSKASPGCSISINDTGFSYVKANSTSGWSNFIVSSKTYTWFAIG